jgi:2-iminobutanoate/2-iminopropanoate deaminase
MFIAVRGTHNLSLTSHAKFFLARHAFSKERPLKEYLRPCLIFAIAMTSTLHLPAQQGVTPPPIRSLPFSPGLQLGDTLYVSGHLGITTALKTPIDAEQEATLVLASVASTLKEAGLTMDDLVYVEIFCTDLSLYSTFNKVYAASFHAPYPARDFIGVKDLLFGNHFEIMGIAVRHAAKDKKQPAALKP